MTRAIRERLPFLRCCPAAASLGLEVESEDEAEGEPLRRAGCAFLFLLWPRANGGAAETLYDSRFCP